MAGLAPLPDSVVASAAVPDLVVSGAGGSPHDRVGGGRGDVCDEEPPDLRVYWCLSCDGSWGGRRREEVVEGAITPVSVVFE